MNRHPRLRTARASPRTLHLTIALVALCQGVGCSADASADSPMVAGGDPVRGRTLARSYGCAACHEIPGVPGADGLVGPSLAGIASRSYIAGVLPNAPENLVRWILNPRAVDSLTAMPNVGLSEADARHITAYLYTLR